jgi:hypothetical protein
MNVIEVGLVTVACLFGAVLLTAAVFDIAQELKNG